MKSPSRFWLTVGLVLVPAAVQAADWPQWLGPERTNVSKETGLLKQWPEKGPPLLWTYRDAGVGYSGPAVVGGRVYLMGGRGADEFVFALDARDGRQLWAAKIGPTFTFPGNTWGDGPRATPTVDGELLYALGGGGDLLCVETATGRERWRKSLIQDLGAEVNPVGGGPAKTAWGFGWSPLVDGEQLVCVPGGSQGTVAALDKKTGTVRWRSKELTEMASYSSPIAVEIGGVRQYVVLTNGGLAGVAARDGALLWKYPKTYREFVIPTPLALDGQIYISVGYGAGCDLVGVSSDGSGFTAKRVKANKIMKNNLGGVVLVDGHLYGYSDKRGWLCQNSKDLAVVWENKDALGPGSLTCADGHLYLLSQDEGTVVLIEATPTEWREKGRFDLPARSKQLKPDGRCWTYPVVADGKLYLRDQELLFCYDIRGGR